MALQASLQMLMAIERKLNAGCCVTPSTLGTSTCLRAQTVEICVCHSSNFAFGCLGTQLCLNEPIIIEGIILRELGNFDNSKYISLASRWAHSRESMCAQALADDQVTEVRLRARARRHIRLRLYIIYDIMRKACVESASLLVATTRA